MLHVPDFSGLQDVSMPCASVARPSRIAICARRRHRRELDEGWPEGDPIF